MDPVVAKALNVDTSAIQYGETLGKGAFGEVKAATYMGTYVAVKAQIVERDSEDYGYLLKEMKIMISMVHPNILRLVAAGKQDIGGDQERYEPSRGRVGEGVVLWGACQVKSGTAIVCGVIGGCDFLHFCWR